MIDVRVQIYINHSIMAKWLALLSRGYFYWGLTQQNTFVYVFCLYSTFYYIYCLYIVRTASMFQTFRHFRPRFASRSHFGIYDSVFVAVILSYEGYSNYIQLHTHTHSKKKLWWQIPSDKKKFSTSKFSIRMYNFWLILWVSLSQNGNIQSNFFILITHCAWR